ncbi:hypothetical protein BH10PSE6_BH10PSE6_21490 [soil metagenome]
MAEAPATPEATAEDANAAEPAVDAAPAERAPTEDRKPSGPRPLPPGWFRATPQMMSLVGCSEPEMADVLRGLGYRVHPPTEESGPLHAFSVKPRFVREREEQRERQRLQERERREQRRRERPERPNERQFFADAPRRDGPGREGPPRDGANRDPRPEGQRPDGPGSNGPRSDRKDEPGRDGPRRDGPRKDGPPRDDRRAPRPPRRDSGGPALRLYATTEKKGEAASDSPFAKLLELKLGGKK